MDYYGFDPDGASVLYISPPMDWDTCRAIELLWSEDKDRPFHNYYGSRYEVVLSNHEEAIEDIDLFVTQFSLDQYLHNDIRVTHFFEYRDETLLLTTQSDRQRIEVAKFREYWSEAIHHFSCFPESLSLTYLRLLYMGEKGRSQKSHTIYLDRIENVLTCFSQISESESRKALDDWYKANESQRLWDEDLDFFVL